MAAKRRKDGTAKPLQSIPAETKVRRPGRTRSIHLTLTPEHEARLRGYQVLTGCADPSEAVMDMLDVATEGMHFYLPGGPGIGRSGRTELEPKAEARPEGEAA